MVKRIIPILFIVFIWIIFAKPYLFENKIPFPTDYQLNNFELWNTYKEYWGPIKNPVISDIVSEIYPWKKLTIDSLLKYELPLWNPYNFSGTPHLANYQSAAFSVTNIFYFLFDFKNAWSLSVLIQPLLAGIFMYMFARSLKLRETSSILSAVSFMFCGIITTWMNWTTISLAISFLPLALFAIEKYNKDKKNRYLILLTISFPLSFFSGHFQISIYFALYIICYILFKFLETKNKLIFLETVLFSFLGIVLSMPQILPSVEFYTQAFRSNIFQKINPVSLSHMPTVLAPDFYGNPISRNNLLGVYAEKSSFVGTVPFSLAILSVFSKNKKVYFFIFMATLSLLFCLDTPFLDLIVRAKIPVISTSSLSRILILFSFSLSILAGFGLNEAINYISNKNYKKIFIWSILLLSLLSLVWISVIGNIIDPKFFSVAIRNLILPTLMIISIILILIISFINKKILTIGIIVIILLTSFDMLRFSSKWQPFISGDNAFVSTPIITKLSKLDKNYRYLGPFGAEGAIYFNLNSTEGYDPLYINRYGQFIGSLSDGKVTPSARVGVKIPTRAKYFPKILDFIGIKYVLAKKSDLEKPWSFPFKNYPKDKFDLIYQEDVFQIYENKNVFPRAYLIGDYVVLNNDQQIIDKLLNDNFDLRKSVVLENNPNIKRTDSLVGEAKIIKYSPNKIIIKTKANQNSILILTDNFYSGWKAKVNGEEEKIIRADFTFRAIPIQKGENEVEFYYESRSLRWGFILFAISIIVLFLIIIGKWYTSRTWTRKQKIATSAIKSSAKTANGKLIPKKPQK